MAISNTSFFNGYQSDLGLIYSSALSEINNPESILQGFVNARQELLGGFSTSDVSAGLTIVSAHLASENSFSIANSAIIRSIIQAYNNVLNSNYGASIKDYFNSATSQKTVPWSKPFKEAFYQAFSTELVQNIGFATWNGTDFVVFPPSSALVNEQRYVGVTSGDGTSRITVSGFNSSIADFALIGDIIVASATSSLPSSSAISLSTTVSSYGSSDELILSGALASGVTSAWAFRPLKNPEYLEFRFGTSSVTGSAATGILSDVVLSVTLSNGSSTTSINVGIGSTNTYGRVNIGSATNTAFKAVGITSILLASGSLSGFGTIPSLEIWSK